jgi:hypothetical protein
MHDMTAPPMTERHAGLGQQRLWPTVLLLGILSCPLLPLTAVAAVMGVVLRRPLLADVLVPALPALSLIGVAALGYAVLLATQIAKGAMSRPAVVRLVWSIVGFGVLLEVILLALVMVPGALDLP